MAEPVGRERQSSLRNPISLFGAWLTTLAAFGFLTYWVVESLGLLRSPYAGLVGVVTLPAAFVLGLLLIPLGIWRENRRRSRGHGPWVWPTLDFTRPRTRQIASLVFLLTLVNLAIVAVAGFGMVHYTESTEFCGQVCHTPMKPQFTAHLQPPHANVDCVQCHVAPGATGFVRAKLAGTRQLYGVITGVYNKPIPSPAHGIPVASETCATCHTPGWPERDITKIIRAYGDDEASTETTTTLTMLVAANHWHARASTRVEYIATDAKRETIPYIRVTDAKGVVSEYFAEGVTDKPAGEMRRMDCMDCHSRPSHTFSASADVAVNRAIAAGQIDRSLPFVHRETVAALSAPYPSETAAHAGIASHLEKFYQRSDANVQRVVAAARTLYSNNVFPDMKVTWGTYLSQMSHTDAPGCFRCHTDTHKTKDGRVVRQDCELCHKID